MPARLGRNGSLPGTAMERGRGREVRWNGEKRRIPLPSVSLISMCDKSLSPLGAGIVTLRWGNGSLGMAGIPAASSGFMVEDGRESLRNGERRRFFELESGVPRELAGSGSVGMSGMSGMDSPSDIASDEGRDNLRKGETLLFGGVSPNEWVVERESGLGEEAGEVEAVDEGMA